MKKTSSGNSLVYVFAAFRTNGRRLCPSAGCTARSPKYAQRMYEKFFGLSRDPFSIAPDPRYLFMSERHREALAHLLYGLDAGGGFVLLSGDIGTGKTTVCRCFLEQIPANCNVAYIFNPKLTVEELLTSICDEFHVTLAPAATTPATAKSLIDPLNTFLLTAHAAGQNNVLIIDEAQNLSSDVLEQLRLLTNLETNERKLLQIILIGQPELRSMLARPELEQLAQRVIARFHLEALSPAETTDYIAHRLAIAGLAGPLPFDSKAMARVYALSRGVPRRINLLCGRALLGAYSGGKTQVDRRTLDKAAREVFGEDVAAPGARKQRFGDGPPPPSRTWAPVLAASIVGVLVGAAVVGAMSFSAFDMGKTPLTTTKLTSVSPPAVKAQATASAPLDTASRAVASAPAASGTAADRDVTTTSRTDFLAAVVASTATENQAWRALAPLWGVTLDNNDACSVAPSKGVFCYVKQPVSLLLIRQLDRPGFLTLTGKNGQPVYALLTALTAETATLTLDKKSLIVPLAVVAETWGGTFSTLWRRPSDMDGLPTGQVSEASTRWLAEQLALLEPKNRGSDTQIADASEQMREPTPRERVNAFQIAQGLTPDGKAGPLTMMQLNRAAGVIEPRLLHPKL